MSIARPTLRNRRTGEEFTGTSQYNLRKQSMFTSVAPATESVEFTHFLRTFERFVADTKSRNPKMPRDKDGNTLLDHLCKDLPRHFHRFGDIKKSGEIIRELTELNKKGKDLDSKEQVRKKELSLALAKLLSQSGRTEKVDCSTTGFLKHMGKTLLTAQLDSIVPGAGLVLPMLFSAAAAQSACPSGNWQIQSGQPAGGQDMCADFSGPENYCSQGYMTCGNATWVSGDPQFSIGAKPSGAALGDAGAAITLSDCISARKVGAVVQEVLAGSASANTTASVTTCSNTLPQWEDFQASVYATLPAELCPAFTSAADSVAQACESNSSYLKWDWIIAGSIIGGVLLIACVIGAACYCASERDCSPPCCD